MRKFVYQGNDRDCGFAALKMLLAHVHRDATFLRLAKTDEKRFSYTYSDLQEIARSNGVFLQAYRIIDKSHLPTITKYPILASLLEDNQRLHMVLVIKIRHRFIYYYDPRRGPLRLINSEFIHRWDGTFLSVSGVKKAKSCIYNPPIIPHSRRLALIALQMLSALFALLGFAFISQQSYFSYPLLFFGLAIICELLFRRYQFIVLKRFDQQYLIKTFADDKGIMRDKYTRYHQFKKGFFLNPQIVVQSLIVATFSALILIFNDRWHGIFLAAIAILSGIEALFKSRFDNMQRLKLTNMEQDVFAHNLNKEAVAERLAVMTQTSLATIKKITARKYVAIFMIAVAALIYVGIKEEATLNFFIFHFLFYTLFHDNLFQLLSNQIERKERMRQDAEFQDEFV